jgi:hypothetical protein
MTLNMDEIVERKSRHEVPCPLVLKSEPARKLEEAKNALREVEESARLNRFDPDARSGVTLAKAALARAREEIASEVVVFFMEALPGDAWEELRKEHLSTTPENEERWVELGGTPPAQWDLDTFPPAAVAACCSRMESNGEVSDPNPIDEKRAKWIWHDKASPFNRADKNALFVAAQAANQDRGWVEVGKDYGPTIGSGRSATTPTTTPSPAPSSAAEPGRDPANPSTSAPT